MKSGPARVLESLRRAEGRVCSGEKLSAEEGVSRAQIWKHVEALREHGYGIDAVPGGGYRLCEVPDRLYPEEIRSGLATRWLAREIRYFDEVDSTNRIALDLARGGAEHGTTVVAEGQSAGRGRLGRSFFSPPYRNLYTSIVLRPRLATAQAPTWILAAAVAVAEAIEASVDDPGSVEIKWPNDVLLLVLGIGVNLNVDRSEFPSEFRAQATSLASHAGRRIDRLAFTRRLYAGLERALDACAQGGFAALRPAFEARFRMPGRRVRVVELDGSEIAGEALGIDADGALRVRRDDGRELRVVAGDVTIGKDIP